MIRHILLAIILLFVGSGMSFANDCPSPEGKSREQMFREIQEFKMKYLAQEMELKEDQQKTFFDLYDEMCRKRFAAMKAARDIEKSVRKKENATEADYQSVTEAMNKAKAQDASIEKEYDAKFSKFLSQKQIFKMKAAEDSFRKKMEEMRHSRKGKHGGK